MGRIQDANGMECKNIDLTSMGQWAIGLALQRTFQTRGANAQNAKKKSTKRNSIEQMQEIGEIGGNEEEEKWADWLLHLSNGFRSNDTHSMVDSALVVEFARVAMKKKGLM